MKASFGPGPNYFDDYVLSRTLQDAKDISKLEKDISKLEKDISKREKDISKLEKNISVLEENLRVSSSQLNELVEKHDEAQSHARKSEIRTTIIKEYLAKNVSGAFWEFTRPITPITNYLRSLWSAKGKKVHESGNFQSFKLYKQAKSITLTFENSSLSSTLAIEIPLPVSPRQLGQGEDDRRLGLGLQKLEILSKLGSDQSRTICFDMPVSKDVINDVVGLSSSEEWGSWSLGDVVILDFCNPLPASFELRLDAFAFGPNIGKTFIAHLFEVQSTEGQKIDHDPLRFQMNEKL